MQRAYFLLFMLTETRASQGLMCKFFGNISFSHQSFISEFVNGPRCTPSSSMFSQQCVQSQQSHSSSCFSSSSSSSSAPFIVLLFCCASCVPLLPSPPLLPCSSSILFSFAFPVHFSSLRPPTYIPASRLVSRPVPRTRDLPPDILASSFPLRCYFLLTCAQRAFGFPRFPPSTGSLRPCRTPRSLDLCRSSVPPRSSAVVSEARTPFPCPCAFLHDASSRRVALSSHHRTRGSSTRHFLGALFIHTLHTLLVSRHTPCPGSAA